MKRVTLQDIADIAGVSRGTVDRVINGRGRVRPEVSKKVLQIAEQLGYSKNIQASRLAQNRNIRVSILAPQSLLTYWKRLAEALEEQMLMLNTAPIYFEMNAFDCSSSSGYYLALQNAVNGGSDVIVFVPYFESETNIFLDQLDSEKTKAYTLGMPFEHFALQKSISFSEKEFVKLVKKVTQNLNLRYQNPLILLHPEDPIYAIFSKKPPKNIDVMDYSNFNPNHIFESERILFASSHPDLVEIVTSSYDLESIILDDPHFSTKIASVVGSLDRNPKQQVTSIFKSILVDFGLAMDHKVKDGPIEMPFYFF